jgi:glycerol kinase
VGVYRDVDDLRARWTESRRWTPAMGAAQRADLVTHWTRAVGRALDWVEG